MKNQRIASIFLRCGGGSCGDQRGMVRGTCAGKPMITRVLAILTVLAAGIALAPPPLSPNLGDLCYDWHATATDASGNTLVCTHTPDSGHLMYWESQVMDR